MRTTEQQIPVILADNKEAIEGKAQILRKIEYCSFCDTKLLFTHDLNLSHLQVVESSRCPGCGVTMQPKTFTLQ